MNKIFGLFAGIFVVASIWYFYESKSLVGPVEQIQEIPRKDTERQSRSIDIDRQESMVPKETNEDQLAETELLKPLSHDQKLKVVTDLSKKALLSDEEKVSLQKIINDPEWQLAMVSKLTPGTGLAYDSREEKERLQVIKALSFTVQYGEIPVKDGLSESILSVIQNDHFRKVEDTRQKKSLIGDKIELAVILKKLNPERYQELILSLEATENKVLDYVIRTANNIAKE